MAFQNSIYTTQGLGKPGTIARLNPLEAIPVVAEGDNVFAGGFVFVGTDPETQVIGPSADTAAKTADDVAGVAVFEKYQIGLTFDASLQIRAVEPWQRCAADMYMSCRPRRPNTVRKCLLIRQPAKYKQRRLHRKAL